MYSTGNGICMPVSVEAAAGVHVADIFARPSVREGTLRLDVTVANHTHRLGGKAKQAEVLVKAKSRTFSLWNNWWSYGLLVGFLFADWWVRRKSGLS